MGVRKKPVWVNMGKNEADKNFKSNPERFFRGTRLEEAIERKPQNHL